MSSQSWKLSAESLETRRLLAADPLLLQEFNRVWSDSITSEDDFYFVADQGEGDQVWRSDGTEDGTIALTDPSLDRPGQPTDVNGRVFFSADRWWLWSTDGTLEGTEEVDAFRPFGNSSFPGPQHLTQLGNQLFFSVDDGFSKSLWSSDGTEEGTEEIMDFGLVGISGMVSVNGVLYLARNRELWKSDGTEAGTVLVKDGFRFNPSQLTDVDGQLFFNAQTSEAGEELWTSDGSASGTTIVKDIRPGSNGSMPRNLTNIDGTLFFDADDGSHGTELWMSDGTNDGTMLVADIRPGSQGSDPGPATAFGDSLVFSASSDGGRDQLWKVSSSGAARITTQEGTDYPKSLTVANDTLYFASSDPDGLNRLWQTDGTDEGTIPVSNFRPTHFPIQLAAATDRLFILARQLWVIEFERSLNDDDRNQDGQIDGMDLDLICSAVVERGSTKENLPEFLNRYDSAAGDANFDAVFDSSDLIAVFSKGNYESGEPAKWSEGDWNCDGVFDSSDLIASFQAGWYTA